MFSIFKRHTASARDDRDVQTDDRSLVALLNEARTPQDLNRALRMARMRQPR
ncbi:MAG: hypothetical protein QOF76_524 [Solirubrobacteraceae bacterium]|jgi:hypothetical protein|nr:hypothetical protein [Solirubrobacteraceae bacterium]